MGTGLRISCSFLLKKRRRDERDMKRKVDTKELQNDLPFVIPTLVTAGETEVL